MHRTIYRKRLCKLQSCSIFGNVKFISGFMHPGPANAPKLKMDSKFTTLIFLARVKNTQKNPNGHPRVVQRSFNGHPTRSNPNHRSLTTWSRNRILRILHSLCFHGRPAVAAKTRKGKKRLQRTRGVNQPQIRVNVKNCHLGLSENGVGPPNTHFIRKMRINFRILGYRTFRQTHFGVEARAAIRFLTISIQISLPQSHQGSTSPPAMRKSKDASWYYVLACP